MEWSPYGALLARGEAQSFGGNWLQSVCTLGDERIAQCRHGDFSRWCAALDKLPVVEHCSDLDLAAPRLGPVQEPIGDLPETLMALHPWRKGPLEIGGVAIDTEWRSDWKWARIAPQVDLSGLRVLDIGCGNGYFGWRMLAAGADLVVGIDPTWVFVMQWLACRHFSGDLGNFVLPLGIEDLPGEAVEFDAVFSMGVLYHRRDPVRHLRRLNALLRPGGVLVLETLVLPDGQSGEVLVGQRRFALQVRFPEAVRTDGQVVLRGPLEGAAVDDTNWIPVGWSAEKPTEAQPPLLGC